MHSARKEEARVAADLFHVGLHVIVVVQPVVDHTPLKSPLVGTLEDSTGNKELVAIGRARIDGVIAGEVALRGLGPDLPAPVENPQRGAEIKALVEAEVAISALVQRAFEAMNPGEDLQIAGPPPLQAHVPGCIGTNVDLVTFGGQSGLRNRQRILHHADRSMPAKTVEKSPLGPGRRRHLRRGVSAIVGQRIEPDGAL